MRVSAVFILLLASAGCASSSSSPQATRHQRIVGGTPSDASQDGVVLITTDQFSCTGSLIAPNLVLTARHCVSNFDEQTDKISGDLDAASLTISVGADASADNQGGPDQGPDNGGYGPGGGPDGPGGGQGGPDAPPDDPGGGAGPDGGAHGMRLFHENVDTLDQNDIALIQLDQDLAGPIIKIREIAVNVGETVTAVGYGEDGHGQLTDGRQQRTGMQIVGVGPASLSYQNETIQVPGGEIAATEGTCHGDSGGPILDAQGQVVGVTSRGSTQEDTCIGAPGIYSAIAAHIDLIKQAAAAAGHPL
jgi:secreted trypsin-like serine protease